MKTKKDGGIDKGLVWTCIWLCLVTLGTIALISNNLQPKSPKAKNVARIQYVHGAIIEKSLDTRTDEKALVYINEQNKVFVIKDADLWAKANIGDSVKIGYTEGGSGFLYNLSFKTVDVIGKAKRDKGDIHIFSSPDEKDNTVIIPMIFR